MNATAWEDKGNKHIDMDLGATLPYHSVVADLIAKYAKADDRIIDLGCGLGHIESELKGMRPELTVDIADAYDVCLEATRARGNINAEYKLDESRFDVKKVIPEGYDIAVMSHVLEHLLFPAKALDDVFSRLKPGGIVIVAVPNPVRPTVFFTNLFKMHYVNRGHVHAWDRSHWRNFLENVMNYEVLEYRTDYIQFPLATKIAPLRGIGKVLAKVFPWWGFSNIAAVRKPADRPSAYDVWSAEAD